MPKSHRDYANVHLLSLRRIQYLPLLLHHTPQKVSFSIQHTRQKISTRGKCVNDRNGHSQLTMAQTSFYCTSKQWFQYFESRSIQDHKRLLRAQFFLVIAPTNCCLQIAFFGISSAKFNHFSHMAATAISETVVITNLLFVTFSVGRVSRNSGHHQSFIK